MSLASLLRYRPAADALIVASAVALAMLLGGGGSPSAATELALQLVLAALVAGWAWIIPPARLQALPRGVWQVAGLIVVLPLLQLLPLPPWLWHALPGRQLEIASLTLVGQQNSWRPLSLTPYQTLASLLAMAAAAAMLVMAAALNRTGRTVVLSAVVTVALVSLVVGEVQIAGGSANLLQFYDSDGGWLLGFQGNHNAQADVLLIAIVACATVARELITQPRRKVQKRVILGVAVVSLALLTLGVVLTASRTGVALLAIALSSALVIMRPLAGLSWRQTLWAIGGGGALFLGATAMLWDNAVIGRTMQRFNAIEEARPQIWQTARLAARQHLPWGTGMGSFIPVYAAVERQDMVDVFYVNRAHDDYLEGFLEAGLMGVVWGLAILCILGLAASRAVKQGQRVSRGQLMCAISGLSIIAVHSLLDYPLRCMSLSALTAVAAGLLFSPVSSGLRSEWKEKP